MTDRISELEQLVVLLRGADGCPWDRSQELSDLRAYLIEEAHEAAAAIDEGATPELAAELGDLLFQIVFAARICEESGVFGLDQIIHGIRDKMIARHPHVFGNDRLQDSSAVREAWERRKAKTRQGSILSGVPDSLPALVGTLRMTHKAAAVGFDWPDIEAIIDKVEEELAELRHELGRDSTTNSAGRRQKAALEEEIGDLMFTVANLARRLDIDPEGALAAANRKFRRRFQAVERKLEQVGKPVGETSLAELDRLWNEVKSEEE